MEGGTSDEKTSEEMMYTTKLTSEQLAYAQREADKNPQGYGGRLIPDKSTWQIVYTGVLGQTFIADLFDKFEPGEDERIHKRPVNTGESDGGHDLFWKGAYIDVKTKMRSVDPKWHFVNSVPYNQLKHTTTHYIFTSVNKRTDFITVCGVIGKKRLLRTASYYQQGHRFLTDNNIELTAAYDQLQIPNTLLVDVKSPLEIIKFIEAIR